MTTEPLEDENDRTALGRTLRITDGGRDDDVVMFPVLAHQVPAVERYLGVVEAQFFGRTTTLLSVSGISRAADAADGLAGRLLRLLADHADVGVGVEITSLTAALDCTDRELRDAVQEFDQAVRTEGGPSRIVGITAVERRPSVRMKPWVAGVLRRTFEVA